MESRTLPAGVPMSNVNPRSTAAIGGHPLHGMFMPVPIICFIGAFITDLVYWKTANMMWADVSAWLITAGLLVAILVVIAGLIDFFCDRRIRAMRSARIYGVGYALGLILSIFNAFIHSRDAYTSVVPTGLVLSGLVVLIVLVAGWNGAALVYRDRVGVRPEGQP